MDRHLVVQAPKSREDLRETVLGEMRCRLEDTAENAQGGVVTPVTPATGGDDGIVVGQTVPRW